MKVTFPISLAAFAVLGSYLVLLMPPESKRKLQLAAARAKRAKLDRSHTPSHASIFVCISETEQSVFDPNESLDVELEKALAEKQTEE